MISRSVRLALLALATPLVASAQTVRGSLVHARDSSAVAGVVVQLLDASGRVVARAMSDDRGEFRLMAASAGPHRVRSLRIGWRPATSPPIELAAGREVATRLVLDPLPVDLATVNVSARHACRAYGDAGAAAELWDQARTAFTAARLSAAERRVEVTLSTYQRDLDPGTDIVQAQRVDLRSGFTTSPFVSLPPDSLRARGYVNIAPGGWTIYYAPDLDVLASDVFLEDHCLRLGGEADGLIGIAFEPTRDRLRLPEIAGTVWLDRRSLELRRLEFRYTHVSRVHQDVASGGRMDFLRLGRLWAIASWHIRMPVIERRAEFGRSPRETLTRVQVSGGELVLVKRGADTLWARPPIALALALTDSATGHAVPSASIDVRGTGRSATANEGGRARITGLLPGNYTVRVTTAEMEALGVAHDHRVTLTSDGQTEELRIPVARYSIERMCPDLTPRDGAIVGTVRARGGSRSAAGLQVFAQWDVFDIADAGGGVLATRSSRHAEATTDARGAFTLCGVPLLTPLRVRTYWDRTGPGVAVRLDDPRVKRMDLVLDPPHALVRGSVTEVGTRSPLPDVEIVLPVAELETRTRPDGSFEIREVPPGPHDIVFRRLGYLPVVIHRAVQADSALVEHVQMARAVMLDSVVVSAPRSSIPGFDTRRMIRQGHAITRAELARQEHRRLSEILATVPGLRILGAGSGAAWASMGRGANTISTLREPDRFSASRGAKPACYSDVYMDGALLYGGSVARTEPAPLMDLNTILASNLEAVEYFAGPAQIPPEYNKTGASCGVLLLWTRRPDPR